jgi:F-type H+-transporting ATPase subunit b
MSINWWTLAFQTINVLILIWLLGRFFFRPLVGIVAKRQEETAKLLADAAAARREADEARASARRTREEIAAERDRLIDQARKAAETEKAGLLAQFQDEIAKRRSEADAAIARDRLAAERAMNVLASEVSVDIARRLLQRLPASAAFLAFRESLRRELSGLSVETKRGLAAADASRPIEIVVAEALPDDQAKAMRQTLYEAIGAEPCVAFRSDPALIAGVEVRGRNLVISSNWKADLEAIRRELTHD